MYHVDNAVIMAAGASSRFAPLSFERPKALVTVKGEVLIERQIRQLYEAGIKTIYVVAGYKAEQLQYLENKYGVQILYNSEYTFRNNHSSIFFAKEVIKNTYICSADNYFINNPFETAVDESYYAALYAPDHTKEWCMHTDEEGYINRVEIGGKKAWYMMGHSFWSEDFSRRFIKILEDVYMKPETKKLFWEDILRYNLKDLRMKVRQYPENYIFEFDSIDELRQFDNSYVSDTRSTILKKIANQLRCTEADITSIYASEGPGSVATGIKFLCGEQEYEYMYSEGIIKRV